MLRVVGRAVSVAALIVAAGCTSDPEPETPADHGHGDGEVLISQPVGDGTRTSEVGYRLADVSLPQQSGAPGMVSFRVLDFDGEPVTHYLEEQTRDLHLYVVRSDLSIFRHLHPVLGDQGEWTARTTLPTPGDYRVITEFIAEDDGGNGDHVVLGAERQLPGQWMPEQVTSQEVGSDGVVEAGLEGDLTVGPNGRLDVVVRDAQGRPVKLGTYLGTYAHITGFHVETGGVVHLHPLGSPEIEGDETRLEVHTEFEEPGEYVFYVQVRVDGFLHTLRCTATVS